MLEELWNFYLYLIEAISVNLEKNKKNFITGTGLARVHFFFKVRHWCSSINTFQIFVRLEEWCELKIYTSFTFNIIYIELSDAYTFPQKVFFCHTLLFWTLFVEDCGVGVGWKHMRTWIFLFSVVLALRRWTVSVTGPKLFITTPLYVVQPSISLNSNNYN